MKVALVINVKPFAKTTLNYGLNKISPLGRVDHWASTFIIFIDFQDSKKLKRYLSMFFLKLLIEKHLSS